jgi:hypothetical protein
MVLVVTTWSQTPKTMAFKEKEPLKTKIAMDWTKEEELQKIIKIAIKQM